MKHSALSLVQRGNWVLVGLKLQSCGPNCNLPGPAIHDVSFVKELGSKEHSSLHRLEHTYPETAQEEETGPCTKLNGEIIKPQYGSSSNENPAYSITQEPISFSTDFFFLQNMQLDFYFILLDLRSRSNNYDSIGFSLY